MCLRGSGGGSRLLRNLLNLHLFFRVSISSELQSMGEGGIRTDDCHTLHFLHQCSAIIVSVVVVLKRLLTLMILVVVVVGTVVVCC